MVPDGQCHHGLSAGLLELWKQGTDGLGSELLLGAKHQEAPVSRAGQVRDMRSSSPYSVSVSVSVSAVWLSYCLYEIACRHDRLWADAAALHLSVVSQKV